MALRQLAHSQNRLPRDASGGKQFDGFGKLAPVAAPHDRRLERPRGHQLRQITEVLRQSFNRVDMTRSGSRCRRSMLSTNTIVPIIGGFGTASFAGGRLNMSA